MLQILNLKFTIGHFADNHLIVLKGARTPVQHPETKFYNNNLEISN